MYKCQMPGCDYETENKSQIAFHHIIPSSMGGTNDDGNIIMLCPNCHTRIYVEGVKSGIHSIKNENSIILMQKYMSTSGLLISYKNIDSNDIHYSIL